MSEKIQEPSANLRTKDQIKVKVGNDGRNVVEAQPAKEQKTIEAKETGVTSPQAPKVGSDRDVGKEVAEEKIAVSQIGSQPSSFTKPESNSNETCYCQKELVLGELIMKAKMPRLGYKGAELSGYAESQAMEDERQQKINKPIKKARDSYATATAVSQEMGYTELIAAMVLPKSKCAVDEEKCSEVKKGEVLTEMLEKAAGF